MVVMVTSDHQTASPNVAIGVEHRQGGQEDEQTHAARRVRRDPTAQRDAGPALEHPQQGDQTQKPQRSEHGQDDDGEIEQVPEEPSAAIRGERQAHDVVGDEGHPHDVHRHLDAGPRRAAEVDDDLPRVDGEEDQGGGGQRPLGGALPDAQASTAVPLRHALHRKRS